MKTNNLEWNSHQRATIDRILTITTRLEAELGLDWMTIRHIYLPTCEGDESVDEDSNITAYKTTAITVTSWQYRHAEIRWFLPMAALADDEMLELLAVHEYMHVLMGPISQLVPNKPGYDRLDEFVTENLARAFYSMRNKTRRDSPAKKVKKV